MVNMSTGCSPKRYPAVLVTTTGAWLDKECVTSSLQVDDIPVGNGITFIATVRHQVLRAVIKP